MDGRRGPGAAVAWVQTSGVGVPPSSLARQLCDLFASLGSVWGTAFFPEISSWNGNWRWTWKWERGWGAMTKALVTCSKSAFIFIFLFLLWFEEKEANSFLFLSVLYQYSSQFSTWNINESAMSNLFLLCYPFKPLALNLMWGCAGEQHLCWCHWHCHPLATKGFRGSILWWLK